MWLGWLERLWGQTPLLPSTAREGEPWCCSSPQQGAGLEEEAHPGIPAPLSPRSLGSPTLQGQGVAASTGTTLHLQFPFWLARSIQILTRSKEMCQPFPSAPTALLEYKNSYFPFGSGISLMSNIMHKRFLIKYDLAWSILLLKSLTLLYAQALIKHQIIIKNKISKFFQCP